MIDRVKRKMEELKQLFDFEVSDINVTGDSGLIKLMLDDFLEIIIHNKNEEFDINLIVDTEDICDMKEPKVRSIIPLQRNFIVAIQYLYDKTRLKPNTNMKLRNRKCPHKVVCYQNLDLTVRNVDLFVTFISEAMNFIKYNDINYLKDINYNRLLRNGLQNFEKERKYYIELKEPIFKKAKDSFLQLIGFEEIRNVANDKSEFPNTNLMLVDEDKAMAIGFEKADPLFWFDGNTKPKYPVDKSYLGSEYFIVKNNEIDKGLVVKSWYINVFKQLMNIMQEKETELSYFLDDSNYYLYIEATSIWGLVMGYRKVSRVIEKESNNIRDFLNTTTLKDDIISTINQSQKIIVFVEGETDEKYINKALRLLKPKLLKEFEIKWVGKTKARGKVFNTGKTGLDSIKRVIEAHPKLISEKIILLYDSDVNKEKTNMNNKLFIRSIPKVDNRKVSKGIENLFEDDLISKEFYKTDKYIGGYGEKKIIEKLDKMKLCNYLCSKDDKEIFSDFSLIINILEEVLEKVDN